jgi:hypothetical protein
MHNLNPLVILHIVAFVTLCEAYMGIDPHFDMWNYFFRARCRQYRDMELTIWGGGASYPHHVWAWHRSLF